jgi:hypothetical protein
MSVHKDCGEPVTWLRRPDDVDKFLPPMEYVDQLYMKVEGPNGEYCAMQASAYKIHRCDPDKMEAWIAYKERIAEIKEKAPDQPAAVHREAAQERVSDWILARERAQEETRLIAEAYKCRRCGAKSTEPCFNLSVYNRTQEKVPTKMPHAQRLEDSGQG